MSRVVDSAHIIFPVHSAQPVFLRVTRPVGAVGFSQVQLVDSHVLAEPGPGSTKGVWEVGKARPELEATAIEGAGLPVVVIIGA